METESGMPWRTNRFLVRRTVRGVGESFLRDVPGEETLLAGGLEERRTRDVVGSRAAHPAGRRRGPVNTGPPGELFGCDYTVRGVTADGVGPLVVVVVELPWTDTTGPLATLLLTPDDALALSGAMVRKAMELSP